MCHVRECLLIRVLINRCNPDHPLLANDSHHDLDGRKDEHGVGALDVGVRDEGTEEGEETYGPKEIRRGGGGVLDSHVHRPMQVAHQIQYQGYVCYVCHHNKNCKHGERHVLTIMVLDF